MRLNTTALIGFSVIEDSDVESHARISTETPPPTVKVAEMLTRNSEVAPPGARLVASMFVRDGEAPGDDL